MYGGVGCLLHQIITAEGFIHTQNPISIISPVGSTNRMKTYGLEFMQQKPPYSQTLLQLIMECLAFTPSQRPNAATILQKAFQVLQIYDDMNTSLQQPTPKPEPYKARPLDSNVLPTGHALFVAPEEKTMYCLPLLRTVAGPWPGIWRNRSIHLAMALMRFRCLSVPIKGRVLWIQSNGPGRRDLILCCKKKKR